MYFMKKTEQIYLPGGFKQFRILKENYDLKDKTIIIIGDSSEKLAERFISEKAKSVDLIVTNYDSLIQSKLNIDNKKNISIRINDFERTDFIDNYFDIAYSQVSISTYNRNNILKEVKRILKPEGIFCVSEITTLQKNIPQFVKNIFNQSNLSPLSHWQCDEYFLSKDFEVILQRDLTSSLKNFYESIYNHLINYLKTISDKEKQLYKKLLNKISHESNVYLKLGGDKYIGLNLLILKNKK